MVEERAAAGERRRGNLENAMKWRSVRTNELVNTYIDFGGGFVLA